jgi:hypothetical protein
LIELFLNKGKIMAGIIAAMENAELEVAGDATEVEAAQTETEVVRADAEVQEAVGDISSDEKNLGEAVAASDELAEIGEIAQGSLENGEGLSEDAAAMATVAVERIHFKMFGTKTQNIVAAKESFGSSNSRRDATIAVVEGVVESIKRIWKGIKAFIQRIWDKIKGLWLKIVGNTKDHEKHLKNLRDRVEKLDPAAQLKEKELKNDKLARCFSSAAGKAGLQETLAHIDTAHKVFGAAKAMNKDLNAMSIKIQAALHNFTKDTDLPEVPVKQMTDELKSALGTIGLGNVNITTKESAAGVTDTYFGPMANGVLFHLSTTSVKDSAGKEYVTGTFGTSTMKKKMFAEKIQGLGRGDMLTLLDKAIELNKKTSSESDEVKSAEKITSTLTKATDDVINSAEKMFGGDSAAAGSLDRVRKCVTFTTSAVNTINTTAGVNAATVVSGVANYVSFCLGNVKFK